MKRKLSTSMPTELWQLYNLIELNTKYGSTTTVQEICDAFPTRYSLNGKECNYSNCPKLYEDIHLINTKFGWQHDKYIITNRNRIKLATEEEIDKELVKVNVQFKRYNERLKALKRLYQLNNQCKLLSNQNNPIDENSKAKRFVESFSDK